MIRRLLLLTACWLIGAPALAADCSPARLSQLQHAADQARAAQRWADAYAALQQLSHCQPRRGDLHIELLRLALRLGDRAAALRQRHWLAQHDLPPALAQLIDRWLASSDPTAPPAPPPRRVRLSLSQGYDSNANDGSRHDTVPVNFNGLPLNWSLDRASRAQPSHYTAVGASLSLRRQRQWELSTRARRYHDLNETELQLYAALRQPLPCPVGLDCSLDLALSARQQADERQLLSQLGTSLSGQRQRLSLYLRHSSEKNAANSQSIGLQWYYALHPRLLLFTGIDYDQPLQPRAGGDRTSLHLGSRWQPLPHAPWLLELLHLQEYEQTPYAPAFWGDTHRDRQLDRLSSEYSWRLNGSLTLRTQLDWRYTQSDLKLYQQQGWSAALQLISTH
jgi:hypothetical protein